MTLRRAFHDITASRDAPESRLNALRNDPIERMLPNEPTDPIENADPIDPTDMNEPREQMLRVESVEAMLHLELPVAAMGGVLLDLDLGDRARAS